MSNRSEQIQELTKALSAAQGQMKGAQKDSENPFFNSKYADLSAVWEAIRKPLADNGLAVTQTTEYIDTRLMLTTTLFHLSGQWISGVFPILAEKQTAQALGSATTYARRYGLMAIVGVAPEDDDGNAASDGYSNQQYEKKKPVTPKTTQPAPVVQPKAPIIPPAAEPQTVGEAHKKALLELAKSRNWLTESVMEFMEKKYGQKRLSLLSIPQFNELCEIIKTQSHTEAVETLAKFALPEMPGPNFDAEDAAL